MYCDLIKRVISSQGLMLTEHTHLSLIINSFRQEVSVQYADYQKRSKLTLATLICHVSFEYLQKKWA